MFLNHFALFRNRRGMLPNLFALFLNGCGMLPGLQGLPIILFAFSKPYASAVPPARCRMNIAGEPLRKPA
jgi:hypothetical protein